MKISKISYDNIKTYNRDIFPLLCGNDTFNTYRKLKESPVYFYFDENYKGVMPVIIVKNIMEEIDLYQINYNYAKQTGTDVILVEKLNVFNTFNYVYVFDDYNIAMEEFLKEKLKYLNSSKDILIEQIKSLEQERSIKKLELREQLMTEVEKKINEMLDIYDSRIICLESKVNRIDYQLEMMDEIAKSSTVSKN